MSFIAEVKFPKVKDVPRFKKACDGWRESTRKGLCLISVLELNFTVSPRVEPGIVQYELIERIKQDSDDPGTTEFIIVERWTSEAAFEASLKRQHVADAIKECEEMGLDEPEVVKYNVVLMDKIN